MYCVRYQCCDDSISGAEPRQITSNGRTLAVKHHAANPFPNGHPYIDKESNACDSDARVLLVGRREVGVVVMVMVARVSSRDRLGAAGGGHGSCWKLPTRLLKRIELV